MTLNMIMATTGKVILSELSLGLPLISDQIKKHLPPDKTQTAHAHPQCYNLCSSRTASEAYL